MNTAGISSNALFGNSANNFIEPFSRCKTFVNIRSSLLIRLPVCFCLCKNYVNADAQCAGVNIGGRKYCKHFRARVNRQCWRRQLFSTAFFIKKQYLSNGQTGCREISHKHCKWMAVHDTKKNHRYHSLFIKLFGHRFFPDTV